MTETAMNLKPSGRSKDEIFLSLSKNIQKMYGNEITEKEAKEAARNLISFGQKLLDLREKQSVRQNLLGAKTKDGTQCEPNLPQNAERA